MSLEDIEMHSCASSLETFLSIFHQRAKNVKRSIEITIAMKDTNIQNEIDFFFIELPVLILYKYMNYSELDRT
ncbi:hypothetical protein [Comamonas sp. JUb58]|uniref:hypothetical protein n=1 Tax=Comamonas sp. JUb58 TaxID=2485114 RepID=UPI00105FE952|nr:hypothetical protein [Comamonas sp. JUb58]TDS70825.1 hypothetical protein EDF71_12755 [Comamonas sp. JUb58]